MVVDCDPDDSGVWRCCSRLGTWQTDRRHHRDFGRPYCRPPDRIVASAFSTRMRSQEILFETEVETALAGDREISERERRIIERLRVEFGLTEAHAQAVIARLRSEQQERP